MTWLRHGRALLREERGYTLVELLTVMGILGVVISALTGLMVSATSANQRMNLEFQAQTEARMALDRIRREGRSACRAGPAGPTTVITLTYLTSGQCPASGGRQVSWCTVANGSSRYGLFRSVGATCGATGTKVADYLTVASAFNYQTASQRRPKIGITFPVDPDPSNPSGTYRLDGDVVLRNSPRGA